MILVGVIIVHLLYMVERVVIPNEGIGRLGCLNLYGLNKDKLINVRRMTDEDMEKSPIHLIRSPLAVEFIILHGHHRAYVQRERGNNLLAYVWKEGEIPFDAIAQLNMNRFEKFHSTAQSLGRGTIEDLLPPQ